MLSNKTQDLIKQLQEPSPAADIHAAVENATRDFEAHAKGLNGLWQRFLNGEPIHEELRAAFKTSDQLHDRLKNARERREAFMEKRQALMQAFIDSVVSDLGVGGEFVCRPKHP